MSKEMKGLRKSRIPVNIPLEEEIEEEVVIDEEDEDQEIDELDDDDNEEGDRSEENDQEDASGSDDNGSESEPKSRESKITSLRQEAKSYSENLERRGVIYMSRIPPFMKPNKARTLFEQFGIVTRIYLAEEDSQIRKRRKTNGGNGSKQFTEGWIEFADKKIAKSVAESLNNSTMGGMKSHFYHDDIWNLKYLKNFKWDYLTEKFAYERRVRENKLKASMMQAKRSNAEFIDLVEKGKQQKYVESRKRKQDTVDDGRTSNEAKKSNPLDESRAAQKGVKRVFRQSSGLSSSGSQYVDKNLLGSVFRNKAK
jgi:ESF2/ABP1 family protein